MSFKREILDRITTEHHVLIVRVESAARAREIAHAAVEGGVRVLEIPLTVPHALDVIAELAERYAGSGVVVGAGTVLDPFMADDAVGAGAEVLVSPNLNPRMLEYAHSRQVATISGAFTPTEIQNTITAGADIVKLFPAEFLGPAWARSVLAPLPHVPLLPAGGVTNANIADWFAAGVVAVATGSAITRAGGHDATVAAAEEFIAAVRRATL